MKLKLPLYLHIDWSLPGMWKLQQTHFSIVFQGKTETQEELEHTWCSSLNPVNEADISPNTYFKALIAISVILIPGKNSHTHTECDLGHINTFTLTKIEITSAKVFGIGISKHILCWSRWEFHSKKPHVLQRVLTTELWRYLQFITVGVTRTLNVVFCFSYINLYMCQIRDNTVQLLLSAKHVKESTWKHMTACLFRGALAYESVHISQKRSTRRECSTPLHRENQSLS